MHRLPTLLSFVNFPLAVCSEHSVLLWLALRVMKAMGPQQEGKDEGGCCTGGRDYGKAKDCGLLWANGDNPK